MDEHGGGATAGMAVSPKEEKEEALCTTRNAGMGSCGRFPWNVVRTTALKRDSDSCPLSRCVDTTETFNTFHSVLLVTEICC